MQKNKRLECLTLSLVIFGGLNWGLVGLFEFDLVATLFGDMSEISRVVYTLVGLSALYMLFTSCQCKACKAMPCKCKSSEHSHH
tara:strand:+ start:1799 stop:2050 length:252 start_codon:yes stop_codon:yes gene_type:complete